jgi:hypothetical protein
MSFKLYGTEQDEVSINTKNRRPERRRLSAIRKSSTLPEQMERNH